MFCSLSVFAAVFFRFRLHSLFVPRNLSVKHYASFCIFMQSKNVYLYNIMINRKLWGIFWVSLAPLSKRPIFLLFVFSLFYLFRYFWLKQKRKRKIPIFSVFAVIRPFLSQIKRWFSVIYVYIGQTTPHHPVFGTRRVGQLSSENFLFFIFCKILWFCQFSFSTEFLEFLKVSYLLFFLHKVSLYLLLAISVRQVAFYTASWCCLSPDYCYCLRSLFLSYFLFLR